MLHWFGPVIDPTHVFEEIANSALLVPIFTELKVVGSVPHMVTLTSLGALVFDSRTGVPQLSVKGANVTDLPIPVSGIVSGEDEPTMLTLSELDLVPPP